jgi:phosphonate transport system substrate-binding protein
MKRIVGITILLSFLAAALGFAGGDQEAAPAAAQPQREYRWQDEWPRIVWTSTSSENEADRVKRYKVLTDYLESRLEVEIEYLPVSDYAGMIEGMKAGKVQVGSYGTASYVRAWLVTDGQVEPLVASMDETGGSGYYSCIYVRADSPYQTLDDLKGKSLAFADPNSTSGFLVPSYYLRKAGKEPDTFFGSTGFAGSHEMGVLAMLQGTYDACATHTTNEVRGNAQRMADKGMIDMKDLRMVWKSPVITNGPIAVPKSMPEQFKKDLTRALIDWPTADPESWKAFAAPSPPGQGYFEVSHERYLDFIEMTKQNDAARKAGG